MIKKILKNILISALILLPVLAFAATVETLPATHISYNSAKMWANIHGGFIGASSFNPRFRYSTNSSSNCQSMPNYTEIPAEAISPAFFNIIASGLISGTTYYYCAVISYQNDPIIYGNILSFKTLGTAPNSGGPTGSGGSSVGSVEGAHTGPATGVTDIEATLNGSAEGVVGTVFGYFRYSTATVPPIFCNEIYGSNMRSATAQKPNLSGQIGNGAFSAKITNLEQGTTYYYCALASNKALNSEGSLNRLNPTDIEGKEVRSFRTLPCQTCPHTTINTVQALVQGATTANLRGQFGSSKGLSTYFEYKSNDLQGDWKKTTEENHAANTYGAMNKQVTGLRANTDYVFRAVGQTSEPTETFYGQTLHFRTQTADGFGDGEGWVYDGPETTIVGNGGPLDPTQTCGQPSGPDAPLVNCDDNNNNGCPSGTTGTPPNCVGNPPPLPCSEGWSGIPPYCVQNPTNCPVGYAGTFPDCDIILIDVCLYGGTYPECNDTGNTCTFGGTYPDCNNPPGTCPFGGTYPNCNGGNGNGGNSGGGGNGGTDIDGDGINNNNDNDIDGDGVNNVVDIDSDGDGIGNGFDSDDDNDGIFDSSDTTPLGNGSSQNDLDGDGLNNSIDTDDDGDGIPDLSDRTPFGTSFNLGDLDGDGIANDIDTDMDGDGIPDNSDTDDDNDGIPDNIDQSPRGRNNRNNNQGGILGIGDETTPPQDAIVRYHEGVETVLIRQIMRNTTLAKKYGYRDGEDLEKFSWYLAHFLGKSYGYVAKNKKEIRVRFADVAAYELKEVGNTTTVYESYDNAGNGKFHITGVRKLNSLFKMIFKYEYYFLKRR